MINYLKIQFKNKYGIKKTKEFICHEKKYKVKQDPETVLWIKNDKKVNNLKHL